MRTGKTEVRTLGGSKKDKNKSQNKRARRKVKLEEKSKEKKFTTIRVPKEDKEKLKGVGVKVRKYGAIRPTNSAKRAKRTLGRMNSRDKT